MQSSGRRIKKGAKPEESHGDEYMIRDRTTKLRRGLPKPKKFK